MTTETDGRVAAHTPGPWTLSRMHTGGFDIMDPRNRDVVTVYGGGVETESREANARLIAAAPDLLEALTMFVEYLDADDQDDTAKGIAKDIAETKARAAIAKLEKPYD